MVTHGRVDHLWNRDKALIIYGTVRMNRLSLKSNLDLSHHMLAGSVTCCLDCNKHNVMDILLLSMVPPHHMLAGSIMCCLDCGEQTTMSLDGSDYYSFVALVL
jgi:hypothetical protein